MSLRRLLAAHPSTRCVGLLQLRARTAAALLSTSDGLWLSVSWYFCSGAATTGALREHEVEGTTFNPDAGHVVGLEALDINLEAIAAACAVCNEARLDCVVRPSFLVAVLEFALG